MQKVKALQTIHGDYGHKKEGDEFHVTDKLAAELGGRGLVESVGDPTVEPEPVKEETPKREKATVSITDNTNKEKKEITAP